MTRMERIMSEVRAQFSQARLPLAIRRPAPGAPAGAGREGLYQVAPGIWAESDRKVVLWRADPVKLASGEVFGSVLELMVERVD